MARDKLRIETRFKLAAAHAKGRYGSAEGASAPKVQIVVLAVPASSCRGFRRRLHAPDVLLAGACVEWSWPGQALVSCRPFDGVCCPVVVVLGGACVQCPSLWLVLVSSSRGFGGCLRLVVVVFAVACVRPVVAVLADACAQ